MHTLRKERLLDLKIILFHCRYINIHILYVNIIRENIQMNRRKTFLQLSAFTNQQNRKYSYLKYCINVS